MGQLGGDLVRIGDLTAGIGAYSTDWKMKNNGWEQLVIRITAGSN